MEESKLIGDLVASDYRSAAVFHKYGIDFCCGGGRTLASVCEDQGIPLAQVEQELAAATKAATEDHFDYLNWSYNRLIDHILETHHAYVKKTIPALDQYLTKVEKVHGSYHPELSEILHLFESLSAELQAHMHKEEMVLFPYIRDLEIRKQAGTSLSEPPFGSIQNPIRMMESEHSSAGDALKTLQTLTGNYRPPEHACNTFIVSYKLLEEFEGDLHKHIHLENNILFPGAIALEKEIFLET